MIRLTFLFILLAGLTPLGGQTIDQIRSRQEAKLEDAVQQVEKEEANPDQGQVAQSKMYYQK